MYHGELIKRLDNIKLIYPVICHNMINRDIQLHWSSLMSKDDKKYFIFFENNNDNCDYNR